MPRTWPARWNGFGPIREIWKRSDRPAALRSEEHTSELQSRLHLVCRLLLEKKILAYPCNRVEASCTLSHRAPAERLGLLPRLIVVRESMSWPTLNLASYLVSSLTFSHHAAT